MTRKARSGPIARRLAGYWKMEAANALLLPAATLWFAAQAEQALGPATLLAWPGAIALLVAGALYWRAKLHALSGRDDRPALRALSRARPWLLALTLVGIAAAGAAWAGIAASPADRWAATAGGLLGALEYVNYYVVQLQHFDRWSDLKRLFAGRGFRRAHLARDIAALTD